MISFCNNQLISVVMLTLMSVVRMHYCASQTIFLNPDTSLNPTVYNVSTALQLCNHTTV